MIETKERKKFTVEMLIHKIPRKGETFIREHDGHRNIVNSSPIGIVLLFF